MKIFSVCFFFFTARAKTENIRTRVQAYNGKMTVYSQSDNGGEVNIEIEKLENNESEKSLHS